MHKVIDKVHYNATVAKISTVEIFSYTNAFQRSGVYPHELQFVFHTRLSAEPVIKNYTDGGTMRQCLFAVALRQDYGQDAAANNAAIGLLEQISDWIGEQDRIGILPILDGNKSSVSLEVVKTGWLEDKTSNTAKYQLQCRLVYYQD